MEADPPAGVTTFQKGPWKSSGCAFPGAAGGGADDTSEEAPGLAPAGASGEGASGEDAGGAASGDEASGAAAVDGSLIGDASTLAEATGSASRAAAGGSCIDAETEDCIAEASGVGLILNVQYDALRLPIVAWTLTVPPPIAVTWPPILMTATLWLLVPQAIDALGSALTEPSE